MTEQTFTLPSGDRNAGVYYLPSAGARDLPVLVYCHGWGCDMALTQAVRAFRDKMVSRGWAVVSFSFYACGETGGDPSHTSYGRWADNLRDIMHWVRAREWADPSRVGCWGISSGTNPCLRIAAGENHPAFVVSTATFITFLGYSLRVFMDNLDELVKGGTAETLGVQAPLSFFKDMIQNAPVHHLDGIRCPVFFLTGGQDNPFRKADALIGYESMIAAGLPAKQLLMPKGDHNLDTVPEAAADEVITWLREIGLIE